MLVCWVWNASLIAEDLCTESQVMRCKPDVYNACLHHGVHDDVVIVIGFRCSLEGSYGLLANMAITMDSAVMLFNDRACPPGGHFWNY